VTFINRLPVDSTTGRAVVSDTAPDVADPYLAGIRFSVDGTTLYILTGAVPATASFQDGFARDAATGRLCALIDDPPALGSRFYNDGVLGDAAGHMCFTAINAIDHYVHGWPVDLIGQVCIGDGGPPPPTSPITKITLDIPDEASNALVSNLYFGNSGSATGFYNNKTTFLTDHPSNTLQTFAGIAPANQDFTVSGVFTGFTVTSTSGALIKVADIGYWPTLGDPTGVYPCCHAGSMTITFSPSVLSVGFNVAQELGGVGTCTFKVFSGATLLTTQTFSLTGVGVFTTFAGYGSS
jgi:hypothetical protein